MLIVPRRRIPTLLHLIREPYRLQEIRESAHRIAVDLGLEQEPWVLCSNGGPRQEVGQVHFHLFTRDRYANPTESLPEEPVWPHPRPSWKLHLCLHPDAVCDRLPHLVQEHSLLDLGYTLVYQHDPGGSARPFHLTAGTRLKVTT